MVDLTKAELIDSLPVVREALTLATGGAIDLVDETGLIVTIRCDAQKLQAAVLQSIEEVRKTQNPEASPT